MVDTAVELRFGSGIFWEIGTIPVGGATSYPNAMTPTLSFLDVTVTTPTPPPATSAFSVVFDESFG